MGANITIENDSNEQVAGVILNHDGGIVPGWDFSVKPREQYVSSSEHIEIGRKYKLILRCGKTMNLVMEDDEKNQEFFAFPLQKEGLTLTVRQLKDKLSLQRLEIEYLCQKILPGIRVEDRVFATMQTYKKSFIASDLVAHVVLHGLAENREMAVAKCNSLQVAKIIIPFGNSFTPFSNTTRYYKLNEDNELVKSLGRLRSIPSDGSRSESHKRFKEFRPMDRDILGLEGWLEKRSKLGYWQKRFFRILDDKKMGILIAYFESTSSTVARGEIPLNHIRMVEMLDNDNNIFNLVMKPRTGMKSYAVRAPSKKSCEIWMRNLREFADRLSPSEVVRKSPLAFVMNDAMVYAFCKLLKSRFFRKDSWICKRGDKADCFYLLRGGTMGIYVRNREGKEQFYCKQRPVSVLGESLFMKHTGPPLPRNASYKALEDCELLYLSTRKIGQFLTQYPGIGGQLHVLFQSGINGLIERVSIFKHLVAVDLAKLKLGLHYTCLREGEVLFYEGDLANEFYIVCKGSLTISQYDHQAEKERILKVVGKAECFGEISLMLSGIPRTAAVTATRPSYVFSLDKDTFQSFLSVAKLDKSVFMRQRIVNTFKTYSIPFFESIPEEKYPALAAEASVETCQPDKVIFKEGDVGDRFYVVSFGEMAVVKDSKKIKILKQGKYFGEIALVVEDTPRTATVMTTKPTVLLSLSKKSFRKFFDDMPEALADAELKIAGKKCRIRSIIYHPSGLKFFTKFLTSQYAEESIEYWNKVRKYRKWAISKNVEVVEDLKAIQLQAAKIASKYVRHDADKKVNISNDMTRKILEIVDRGMADAATFLESEEEVVTLMSRDKLQLFKNSKEFQILMDIVGTYEVDVTTMTKGGKKRGGSLIEIKLHDTIQGIMSPTRDTRAGTA